MNEPIKKILKSFLIKAVLLFVGWLIIYHGFIMPDGRINNWLTTKVVETTKIGLTILGYKSNQRLVESNNPDSSRYIYIDDQPVVLVADACNGLELMALYIGFLISFPGNLKWKALFIPIGSMLIFTLNVIREIILALNYKYFQQTFDFNHKYTYVFTVYLFIFLIWRFWLNNFSEVKHD